MNKWPSEFADILNPTGKNLLQGGNPATQFELNNNLTPYINYRDIVDSSCSAGLLELLESHWPLVQRYDNNTPLEPGSASDPNLDYVAVPYNQHYIEITCGLASKMNDDQKAFFGDSGLREFARSASLKKFAEQVTGYRLVQNDRDGITVICYEAGDYVAPHTDVKWPMTAGWEGVTRPIAYVDVHLTFATDAVEHQYLIIQNGSYLNDIRGGMPVNGTVAIYRQPFWHYTTPLVAKLGREKDARRWIVMFNFELEENHDPKMLRTEGE